MPAIMSQNGRKMLHKAAKKFDWVTTRTLRFESVTVLTALFKAHTARAATATMVAPVKRAGLVR